MRLSRRLFAAGLSLLLTVGSSALAAQGDDTGAPASFTLKLEHPSHVGDTYAYKGKFSFAQKIVVSQSGKTLKTESVFREVSGVVRTRVLKAADNGCILQERAQLENFQGRSSESAALKPLSVTGATVEATLWPKVVIKRTDGKPISKQDLVYLSLAFERANPNMQENDDTVFGPPGPVSVGDEWEANHTALASSLSSPSEMTVPESSITSTFTLASTERINSLLYLHINGHVKADPVTFPLPKPLKGDPLTGVMQIAITRTTPADPALEASASGDDMQLTARGAVQNSSGVFLNVVVTQKGHREYTLLPGGSSVK